jgi:hypothetical protein
VHRSTVLWRNFLLTVLPRSFATFGTGQCGVSSLVFFLKVREEGGSDTAERQAVSAVWKKRRKQGRRSRSWHTAGASRGSIQIHLPLYLYVSSPARLLLGGLPVFLGWNQICFHDAVLRDAHGDWPDFSCEKNAYGSR